MTSNISKIKHQFSAISALLNQMESMDYVAPIREMGNASIGQHVRHTIEIAQSLVNGYISGEINYEKRKRDLEIETSLKYASRVCEELVMLINRGEKKLVLKAESENSSTSIKTSYGRELHFVLEHTIHHMALIKTGLNILKIDLTDDSFGVAYSTIQYRAKSCAQ